MWRLVRPAWQTILWRPGSLRRPDKNLGDEKNEGGDWKALYDAAQEEVRQSKALIADMQGKHKLAVTAEIQAEIARRFADRANVDRQTTVTPRKKHRQATRYIDAQEASSSADSEEETKEGQDASSKEIRRRAIIRILKSRTAGKSPSEAFADTMLEACREAERQQETRRYIVETGAVVDSLRTVEQDCPLVDALLKFSNSVDARAEQVPDSMAKLVYQTLKKDIAALQQAVRYMVYKGRGKELSSKWQQQGGSSLDTLTATRAMVEADMGKEIARIAS